MRVVAKVLVIMVCSTVLSMVLCGCMLFGPNVPEKMKIGVVADYPPVIYQEDGKLKGFEFELAQLLNKEHGVKIEFVPVAWDESVSALDSGKIDMLMAGMSITEKRMIDRTFTIPHSTTGQMALMRQSDFVKYGNPEHICKAKAAVGVVKETTGEQWAREFCSGQIVAFANIEQAVNALADRGVDLVIFDGVAISWYVPLMAGKGVVAMQQPLTREQLAWVVKKDNLELKAFLDQCLAEWRKNGKLSKLQSDWLPKVFVLELN